MNLNINIFYTTCGSAKQSKELAKAMLSDKMIVCVNVVKNVALDAQSIMASYKPAQIKSDPDLQQLVADLQFNSFTIKSADL